MVKKHQFSEHNTRNLLLIRFFHDIVSYTHGIFIDFSSNLNQIGKGQLNLIIIIINDLPHNQYRGPCDIPHYDSQGLAEI